MVAMRACLVSCSVSGKLSLRCSRIWGALSTDIRVAQRCAEPASGIASSILA